MKTLFYIFFIGISFSQAQTKLVGGGCECCEAIFQGIPEKISNETKIADQNEKGEPLEISGTIYKKDGKIPAKNVILYIYHTDTNGLYSRGKGEDCAKRHGKLRGWIKTDETGKYKITTIRPAPYPNADAPAHIHPVVKEEDKNEYYFDEFLFDDDKFLTKNERNKLENRCGSGIMKIYKNEKGVWVGKRDIVLGLNIPNYY